MKRTIFSTILLLLIFVMVGCSKKEIHLTKDDDITTNTFLIKRNGTLQVAIVEDFDRDYYNLGELNEFVSKEIDAYNSKAGDKKVTIEDLSIKNDKVVMLLNYAGMEHYATFNNVTAAYFGTSTQNIALALPDQYLTRKGSKVDRATAFDNDKYRVLVIYEPFEVIVDGDIKYYSENANLKDDNRIQSSSEGATVVVYKPAN